MLYLFFATALGIFLGTISRSMAQFALLIILVIVVLMLLSGGSTPVESQPKWLQYLTYLLPARHFVSFSQVIIYRGGGLRAVWLQFLMVAAVGLGFFVYSLCAVPQVDRGQQIAPPGPHAGWQSESFTRPRVGSARARAPPRVSPARLVRLRAFSGAWAAFDFEPAAHAPEKAHARGSGSLEGQPSRRA